MLSIAVELSSKNSDTHLTSFMVDGAGGIFYPVVVSVDGLLESKAACWCCEERSKISHELYT